jgi:hypothetical protein
VNAALAASGEWDVGYTCLMEARPWQEEMAERISKEIDGSLIDSRLRMTPTERLMRLQSFLKFLEEAKKTNGASVPAAH